MESLTNEKALYEKRKKNKEYKAKQREDKKKVKKEGSNDHGRQRIIKKEGCM